MLATNYSNGGRNSGVLTFSGGGPVKQTPSVVARLTGVAKNQLELETREAVTAGSIVQGVGQVYIGTHSLRIEGQFHVTDCRQMESGRFAARLAFSQVGSGNLSSVNLLALVRLVTAGKRSSDSTRAAPVPSEDAVASVKGILMIRRDQSFPNPMHSSPAAETEQGLSVS